MVRKTLIRRMMNYLPMSIELAAALQVDEAVDQGKRAYIQGDFSVIEEDDDDVGAAAAAPVAGQVVDGELKPDAAEAAAATAQKAATGDGAGEASPDIDGLIKEAEALAQKGSDLCLDLCRNLPIEEADRIRAIYHKLTFTSDASAGDGKGDAPAAATTRKRGDK
jgi:hypothetical protein